MTARWLRGDYVSKMGQRFNLVCERTATPRPQSGATAHILSGHVPCLSKSSTTEDARLNFLGGSVLCQVRLKWWSVCRDSFRRERMKQTAVDVYIYYRCVSMIVSHAIIQVDESYWTTRILLSPIVLDTNVSH